MLPAVAMAVLTGPFWAAYHGRDRVFDGDVSNTRLLVRLDGFYWPGMNTAIKK